MPVNKNALLRYKTIDNCLRNRARKWTLENLIDACSDALYEYTGKDEYISRLDSNKQSAIEVCTKYSQSLSYAQYRDGKLSVGEKVTGENASQRIIDTFRCTSKADLDAYLEKMAAEVQKEEVTVHNMGLRSGDAIGWFGFQRYKDSTDSSSVWSDDNIFGWWGTDDFVITKLEGVIYLKDA